MKLLNSARSHPPSKDGGLPARSYKVSVDKERDIVADVIMGIERAIQRNDSRYLGRWMSDGEYAWSEGFYRQCQEIQMVLFTGACALLKLDLALAPDVQEDRNVRLVQYYGMLCFAWCSWVSEKKSRKRDAVCKTKMDTVTNDMNLGDMTEDEYRSVLADYHNGLPLEFLHFGALGEALVDSLAEHQKCPIIMRPDGLVSFERMRSVLKKFLKKKKAVVVP